MIPFYLTNNSNNTSQRMKSEVEETIYNMYDETVDKAHFLSLSNQDGFRMLMIFSSELKCNLINKLIRLNLSPGIHKLLELGKLPALLIYCKVADELRLQKYSPPCLPRVRVSFKEFF